MEEMTAVIKKNVTLPNLLSIIRIALIIPFVMSVLCDNYTRAGIILVISGLSDLFDGMLARWLNQITKLGEMLDPVADKLTLVSVMVCVGAKFPEVVPFVTILVCKEAAMLIASAVLLKRNKMPPSAKWYGKIATVSFYISVIIIMTLKAVWGINNKFITIGLMSATVGMMLYAVMQYLKIFVSMIKSDKQI